MVTFLYRLGRFSFQHRRWVAASWLLVMVAALAGALTLSGPMTDSFRIPGTPSQEAIDLLGERFPQAAAGGATARVVFAAPAGKTLSDPAYKAAIGNAVAEFRSAPLVAEVSDPFSSGAVNQAGTVGFAQVIFAVPDDGVTTQARDAILAAIDSTRATGLTVEAGGDAMEATPAQGASEAIGLIVAAVVLLITLGSLVAAGLPLLTAILGIVIGIGAITTASGFTDLSATTPILALMLGLAVAIDYALFIVSRYRHEIALGRDLQDAAARAVGTAGSAVVFAGLTVIIALAALSVVGVPFLTQMGLAAAFTVAVAVVIALTLLPAMLGFAGRKVLGRQARQPHPSDPEASSRNSFGARWARFVARRPVAVLAAAVAVLGVVSIPVLDLRLGLPDDSSAAPDTTQRKAYDLLAAGFGPGFNGPLTIVVDAPAGQAQTAAEQAAQTIRQIDGVAAVAPPIVNQAGDTAILPVIPASGPSDAATEELVRAIRDQAGVGVTGLTAVNIDISAKLRDALVPYLAIVVGLALLLLMLVFRSLLVPIKAAMGFLLSVAATFGALVAVFQWGWLADVFGIERTGPIISFLPIFLIGTVFGLAMDYQVFLVTRMREDYVHGTPARHAVISGFSHGARVVTAAALIMISVFSGFILSPDSIIKSVGFGLGIAVLFDAIIVRMTIVPAMMALLGRAAWWLPRWLDRILPNVDVEGDKLRHQLDQTPAAPSIPAAEREMV